MLVDIRVSWLRNLHWSILVLLSFCIQDVFAATDASEIGGIVAAGILGMFLLIVLVIAVVYSCKRLKKSRKKDIYKRQEKNRLPYGYGHELRPPVLSSHQSPIANGNIYGGFPNTMHQDLRGITNHSISQALTPATLETRTSVHETYDTGNRRPDSEFILKKREDISSDVGRVEPSEYQTLSAMDFMINSKRERYTPRRSDLRNITSDNNNTYSLKNGGMFLNVGDSSQDEYPVPDYDDNSTHESERHDMHESTNNRTNGFDLDLLEIKRNSYTEHITRSYEGNWFDSYKQVQFKSDSNASFHT